MAVSENVTSWAQDPDDVLTLDVAGQVHQAEAPFHSNPQWVVGGGPLPEPTGPEANDSLFVMQTEPAITPFVPSGGGFGHDYSYGRTILFHPAWAQVWFGYERVRPLAVPLVDNDGNDWRVAREMELTSAFQDAHPDAYQVTVEWEGWDFSGKVFGSRRDRVLHVETDGSPSNGATELVGVDAGDQSPKPAQVEGDLVIAPLALKVAPPKPEIVAGTYLPGFLTSSSQTEINYALVDFADTLANLPSGLFPSESRTDVPDELFDDGFLPLTFEAQPWRRTRSLLLWIIPNTDIARRFSHGQVLEYDYALHVGATFTPPRHRIRYFTDTVPIQQTFARDDDLGGGAFQTWPPSTSEQQSNQTFGGYL